MRTLTPIIGSVTISVMSRAFITCGVGGRLDRVGKASSSAAGAIL